MTYKMFIDDERYPKTSDWMIVRSSYDAIACIKHYGLPTEIAFDHDLGGDDTAMRVVHWLQQETLDGHITIPSDFKWSVHSQNPIGAKRIQEGMEDLMFIRNDIGT